MEHGEVPEKEPPEKTGAEGGEEHGRILEEGTEDMLDMGERLKKEISQLKLEQEEVKRMRQKLEEQADRMDLLEDAMKMAKEYADKLGPLEKWLDKTEKKIKEMETVPTEEDQI